MEHMVLIACGAAILLLLVLVIELRVEAAKREGQAYARSIEQFLHQQLGKEREARYALEDRIEELVSAVNVNADKHNALGEHVEARLVKCTEVCRALVAQELEKPARSRRKA